jgi:hypothetical protein
VNKPLNLQLFRNNNGINSEFLGFSGRVRRLPAPIREAISARCPQACRISEQRGTMEFIRGNSGIDSVGTAALTMTARANTTAWATFIDTNTVEGFYSIFRRGMKGIYQHCADTFTAILPSSIPLPQSRSAWS